MFAVDHSNVPELKPWQDDVVGVGWGWGWLGFGPGRFSTILVGCS